MIEKQAIDVSDTSTHSFPANAAPWVTGHAIVPGVGEEAGAAGVSLETREARVARAARAGEAEGPSDASLPPPSSSSSSSESSTFFALPNIASQDQHRGAAKGCDRTERADSDQAPQWRQGSVTHPRIQQPAVPLVVTSTLSVVMA